MCGQMRLIKLTKLKPVGHLNLMIMQRNNIFKSWQNLLTTNTVPVGPTGTDNYSCEGIHARLSSFSDFIRDCRLPAKYPDPTTYTLRYYS